MFGDENKPKTTPEKVELFEVLSPLLRAMYLEFKEFSKKKSDGVLSVGNVKFVNRLLEQCRKVLKDERSIGFLDLIEEDKLPQNSDVVLMLSQYVAAMDQFKEAHHGYNGSNHDWFL